MFNHKFFAKEMYKQSKDIIPSDFLDKEKNFISTKIFEYTLLAGEALNNDDEIYDDEQKTFAVQVIAEWTFHKCIDLIKGEIPEKYRNAILEKIAFTVFEVTRQGFTRNISEDQILRAVEHHIQKVYDESIDKLPIKEEIKIMAKAQSKIDNMAEATMPEAERKNKINWNDALMIILGLSLFVGLKLILKYVNLLQTNPSFQMFCIILFVIIIGTVVSIQIFRKLKIKRLTKEHADIKQKMKDLIDPNRMYERLGVDVICLQLGHGLLCIADPDQEGLLLAKLPAMRQQLTDTLGYIIPHIRIVDSTELKNNEFSISVRDNVVFAKCIEKISSPETEDIIIKHLQNILIEQVDNILSEEDVEKYINKAKDKGLISIDNLLENLTYYDIRNVFVNLIREKVSIKDSTLILSRLANYSRYHKEPDILSEKIRKDFSRQISLANSNKDKKIYAVNLSGDLTNNILKALETPKELGKMKISLDKSFEKVFIEKVTNKLFPDYAKKEIQPILLVNEKIRLALYRLLVKHIPTIVVLADTEIESDIQLEIIDTIS